MDKDIVRRLKSAADRWEAENLIIGIGKLRVCDALRDSAYAIEDLDSELSAYRALGNIDDLTDLVKDNNEGRVVVLPCNIGDTVYVIAYCGEICMHRDDDYKTGTGEVQCPFENSCDIEKCDDNHIRIFETECVGFMLDDRERMLPVFEELNMEDGYVCFGENTFLTRAEAEAALKGKQHGTKMQ